MAQRLAILVGSRDDMATATKRKLTKKQKGFADDYLDTGNGTQSALKNYDTESSKTASVIAAENLVKPNVIAYLEENADGAASRIVELSKSADMETVRLNANKDILDRAGYKPPERNINMNVNIKTIDATNPKVLKLIEELRNANEQKDKN